MTEPILTAKSQRDAVDELSRRDRDLRGVVERFSYPPHFRRPTGFRTLMRIILEQQVSLASAHATYQKLCGCLGGEKALTPENLLKCSDEMLRASGFSRQKTRYTRALAQAITGGGLNLHALHRATDDDVRARLTEITGIGDWTANAYLMMALARPDIWPVGDMALAESIKRLKGLKARPHREEFISWGDRWRPWRSVAAHLLWHDYLSRAREAKREKSV